MDPEVQPFSLGREASEDDAIVRVQDTFDEESPLRHRGKNRDQPHIGFGSWLPDEGSVEQLRAVVHDDAERSKRPVCSSGAGMAGSPIKWWERCWDERLGLSLSVGVLA